MKTGTIEHDYILQTYQYLPNNTNLNNMRTPGMWYITPSRTYTNAPTNYGVLEVIFITAAACVQRITTEDKIYVRYYYSNTWTNWTSIYTSTVTLLHKDYALKYEDSTTLSAAVSLPDGYNMYNAILTPLPYNTVGVKVSGVYRQGDSKWVALAAAGKTFASTDTLNIQVNYIPIKYLVTQ